MQVIHKNNRSNEAKNAKSLGLTCFQFALALLLPSSHTRLGLCGSVGLCSQIEQMKQRIAFSQKLSTITQNSSATVGDGKVMLM